MQIPLSETADRNTVWMCLVCLCFLVRPTVRQTGARPKIQWMDWGRTPLSQQQGIRNGIKTAKTRFVTPQQRWLLSSRGYYTIQNGLWPFSHMNLRRYQDVFKKKKKSIVVLSYLQHTAGDSLHQALLHYWKYSVWIWQRNHLKGTCRRQHQTVLCAVSISTQPYTTQTLCQGAGMLKSGQCPIQQLQSLMHLCWIMPRKTSRTTILQQVCRKNQNHLEIVPCLIAFFTVLIMFTQH